MKEKNIDKKLKNIKKMFLSCINYRKLSDFMRFYDIFSIISDFDVKFTSNDDGFTNYVSVSINFSRNYYEINFTFR